MAWEGIMIRTDLLDIAFDGVIDKDSLKIRGYYTEQWYNHHVATSELLNQPDFIKKWLEYNKKNNEILPESIFSITVSHKYNSDWFTCTVDFFKKAFKPSNVIDFVGNEHDDEMVFISLYGTLIKRSYKYEIHEETAAQKLNKALKKHVQWFNNDCQNIYNTVCQMDLKTLNKNIKELNLKIKEAENNLSSYVSKSTKSITMLCEAYKDIQ